MNSAHLTPRPPARPRSSALNGLALEALQVSSAMTTALTMTAAVAHGLELPAKMRYEGPLYVRLHRTLYDNFGRVAGPAESASVLGTAVLAWLAWRRASRRAASATAAAGALAAAHAIFWTVVAPANKEMISWPLDAIPPDWKAWRNRWEYGHAVRAGLVTAGLAALIWALLDR